MSWFADLTPYTYHEHVGGEAEPNTLNIGWLDTGMEFSTGECDRDVVARLRDLCRDGVNRTRGLYRCNLCSTYAFGGIWPPESPASNNAAHLCLIGCLREPACDHLCPNGLIPGWTVVGV